MQGQKTTDDQVPVPACRDRVTEIDHRRQIFQSLNDDRIERGCQHPPRRGIAQQIRTHGRHPRPDPVFGTSEDAQGPDMPTAALRDLSKIFHIRPRHQHGTARAEEPTASAGDMLNVRGTIDEMLQL
ncbi:hypothetical protein ABZX85_25455 [Streptomyces sp. NPDC004539]|uniref:hypothetical protein n=1 Tax=Streptomyces sp. NPDC004539 TaxID=3154280 RepID=UPI0033B49848